MRDDPRLDPGFWERGEYDPQTVEAVGKVTDALESVEVARGHLYAFHRMMGTAEREISEAVHLLAEAGHEDIAERLRKEFAGRDALEARWSFQIVEEYDGLFYRPLHLFESQVRDLVGGHRHLHEARIKCGLLHG